MSTLPTSHRSPASGRSPRRQRPACTRAGVVLALTGLSFAAQAGALPFAFAPSANIQYDWTQVDSDRAGSESNQDFRRAKLGFKLKDPGKRWQFVTEHDFADKTPPDAYLELTPADGHSVRIGQFKQPFLLEDAVSDKHAPLLEQSPVGVFAISRRIGIEYARAATWGTVNTAVFGQRLDGTSESIGASMRGTWLLQSGDSGTAHVGMSLASESPDNRRASFSVNPGTTLTDLRLASTGGITAVDRLDRAALEGVWIRNAWSLQGEIARVTARRDGANFDGNAGSLLLTWSPTGDGRSYKRGVVGAPAPEGRVAWELALRAGSIDLDDGAIAGGRVDSVGVAATCTINKHLRVLANVLQQDSKRRGVDDETTVASLRVQLTY